MPAFHGIRCGVIGCEECEEFDIGQRGGPARPARGWVSLTSVDDANHHHVAFARSAEYLCPTHAVCLPPEVRAAIARRIQIGALLRRDLDDDENLGLAT